MRKPRPRPTECSLLVILDAIAGKWPMMVMATLWEGPKRFNELRRAVGASQKMLSQTLKQLEQDGLISRTVTPTVPISVEYATTPLGETLAQSIRSLWDWSERNVDEVMASRRSWANDRTTDRPLSLGRQRP